MNAIAKLIALCDLKQEEKEELVLTTLVTALNSADMPLHETLLSWFHALRTITAVSRGGCGVSGGK